MKNRIFLWLLCCFTFSLQLKSQITTNATDSTTNLVLQEVISVDSQGFIIFKTDFLEQPTCIEFSFYDTNLQLVSTHKMPTIHKNEFFAIEKVFIWQGKLIMHASLYLPESQKNQLVQYQFSLPDLKPLSSKLVLVSKAPKDIQVPYFSKLSPDKSKLLVVGWNYNKSKENARITMRVLDENLAEIRRQTYQFDYENRRFAIEDVFIDNAGNVYVAGNNYNSSLAFSPISPILDQFVLGLFPNSKEKMWRIEKDKYKFPAFKFNLNSASELIGTGFIKKGVKEGIAFFKINPKTITPTIQSQVIIKKDFQEAYRKNNKNFKTPTNDFSGYELNQFIAKADAYFLIGERVNFNYLEDILVIKLDLSGNLIWLSRIPKQQDDIFGTGNFSYSLLERKEKFYFLFNDDYENYKKEGLNEIKTAEVLTAQLATAELNLATGELNRRPVRNFIKKDYLFIPRYCKLIGKEEALLISSGILTNTDSYILRKVLMGE